MKPKYESGIVYKTLDYSSFKVNAWVVNRMLPKMVDKLAKSIEKNGWLEHSYIVVDENLNVIDGHYRLFAAMKCWSHIHFIVTENPKSIYGNPSLEKVDIKTK